MLEKATNAKRETGMERNDAGVSIIHDRPKFARFSGLVLVGALLAFAGGLAAQQSAPGGRKVIQNQAEYNAYITAVNTKDAAARAASLDAFVHDYPRSVVYTDALEEEMGAWRQAGDIEKVRQTAKRLLSADAGNVRALAIVVELDRNSAARGDRSALDELCIDSTGGMREIAQWQKPYGMSDADFQALQDQMTSIFDGAAGFCAWQQKNYAQAQDWLSRAFALDKTDMEDAYRLAEVDFEMQPLDPNGFWYCARAIHLAEVSNQDDFAHALIAYCRDHYANYHGGVDGWEAVLAAGQTQDAWPANFGASIKPAPAKAAPSAPHPQ